jgi:hypothetical protein
LAQAELTSKRFEVSDAVEAIEMFYERGWTDGLPVVPPTEERVREFLAESGRQPEEVVGAIPQRNRVMTAEKIAINAVMAGCLPSYAPVVMAAVEATTSDRFNPHASTASTGGAAPLIIVSGPIVRELEINSGANLFGPGRRANATIGRALRLVLMNLGGAVPGVLDRATLGHPGKFSYCIGENEEASPWEPLRVDLGFGPEASTVTVVASESPHQVGNNSSYEPRSLLDGFVDTMIPVGSFTTSDWVVVVCPEHAAVIGRHGWSREDVKSYLFERCRRSLAALKRTGRRTGEVAPGDEEQMVPMLGGPEEILLMVAGGGAGGFSAVIPPWTGGYASRAETKEVQRTHNT